VRRLLAILLLSVINFPLIAPAMSAQTGPELPPCCRMAGKHKCVLERAAHHRTRTAGVSVSSIRDRCPFTPAASAVRLGLHAFALNGTGAVFGVAPLIFAAPNYTQPDAFTAFDRAHGKRGPPQFLA
jgi:hypothetical protein